MPDRNPVGWLLLEARKKKLDIIIFSLCEACLSTNDNIITTYDSKGHRKCKSRVKFIIILPLTDDPHDLCKLEKFVCGPS